MQIKDKLWKAVIEEFFLEILDFFYKEFLPQIDLSKGFTFLDKELQQLFADSKEELRKADKLVKIFLKDGTERWLLIHIEVQGYSDPNFARRMFTTYYRLLDKFNQPIEALVIYTDRGKKHHYQQYVAKALKTELLYKFNSFEITKYTTEEYNAMNNPLAVIFQTAQLGLKSNWKDDDLLERKTDLFRNLLKKGYDKRRIRVIASFIKSYVSFSKPEYNRKFDDDTTLVSKNISNMGIIETIQQINKELEEKGMQKGIQKGKIEATLEAEKKQLVQRIQRIQRIHKSLNKKIAVNTIALIEEIPNRFVKDVKKFITEENLPVLIQDINQTYQQVKVDTPLEIKQKQLVQLWIKYQFTNTAIATFLEIPLDKIVAIRKKIN